MDGQIVANTGMWITDTYIGDVKLRIGGGINKENFHYCDKFRFSGKESHMNNKLEEYRAAGLRAVEFQLRNS